MSAFVDIMTCSHPVATKISTVVDIFDKLPLDVPGAVCFHDQGCGLVN
jgi:hypothetical protein